MLFQTLSAVFHDAVVEVEVRVLLCGAVHVCEDIVDLDAFDFFGEVGVDYEVGDAS